MQQAVTDGDGAKVPEHPLDLPPESFCLSKDDELEWFDRNAFYERKESTKLTYNGAITRNSSNNTPTARNYTASPRTNRNPSPENPASIFGFPKSKYRFADASAKERKKSCPHGKTRLFADQTGSNPDVIEPPSPKVSCTGRVRRNKGRPGRSGLGFLAVARGMMARLGCRRRNALETDGPYEEETKGSLGQGSRSVSREGLGESEPPELGSLKRFSSCRRPDMHCGSAAVEFRDIHVVITQSTSFV